MAKNKEILDIVPEVVKLEQPVKEVVVYDSSDKTIKLVTEREARNPRYKYI
jgi:hypothetical protein